VDIVQKAFMFCPVLGAAAGHLVDGVTGATSGVLIPMGPLIVMWLFGTGWRCATTATAGTVYRRSGEPAGSTRARCP